MKLIINERQTKILINNILNEDSEFKNVGDYIGNFWKNYKGNDEFSQDMKYNGDEDMVHPLGKYTRISSNFGQRDGSIGSRVHKGIDFATPSGSKVFSPLEGRVLAAKDTTPNGCGGFVMIDHGKIKTKFCHLRQWVVNRGDVVKKGQLIGYSGGGNSDPYKGTSTGPHLHYEILNQNNIAMNPITTQNNLT